jgi:hypothetical protein
MTDESFDKKRKEFLMHYIFCPLEVELSADYEEILLSLNVWPKGCFQLIQKKKLLSQPSFSLGKTRIVTGCAQTTITFQSERKIILE